MALSLNAMTQSSPSDDYPSSVPLSPARSSPIICLTDTLIVLLWLSYGLYSGHGFLNSAKALRNELGLRRNDSEGDLKEGIPASAIIFFALGPLPQAVKLLGCKGVPWTVVWCFFYLVSFLLNVGVIVIAGPNGSANERTSTKPAMSSHLKHKLVNISQKLTVIGYVVQITIWAFVLVRLDMTWFKVIGIIAGGLLGSIVLMVALYLIPTFTFIKCCGDGAVYVIMTYFVLLIAGAFIPACQKSLGILFGLFLKDGVVLVLGWIGGILLTCLLIIILIAIGIAIIKKFDELLKRFANNGKLPDNQPPQGGYQRLPSQHIRRVATDPPNSTSWSFDRRLEQKAAWQTFSLSRLLQPIKGRKNAGEDSEDDTRRQLALSFALANLIFGLLYYCFGYSDKGTWKPGWTDMLG